MACEYSVQQKEGYLLFKLTGSFDSSDEVVDFATSMIRIVLENQCLRVVLDEHELQINFDQFDAYSFAEKLTETAPRIGIRIGTIRSDESQDYYRWLETTLRNRSVNYRIFADESEAVRWVRE